MPSTLTFHAPACPNPRCGQGKLICIIHLSASGSLFLFRILVTGLQVLHCRPLPLPTPSSHHYTPLLWQCCVTAHCNAVKNADIHILVHTGDDGILFWCNPPQKKNKKWIYARARARTRVPSSAASSMLSSLSSLPSSGDGDIDTDGGKRGSITSTGSGTIYDEDHLPVSRRASAATPTPEGEDAVFEGEEQRTNSATTTSTTNTSIGNGADIASAAKLAGVVGKDFVEGGREAVATDGEHDIGLVDSDSETWSVGSVR